MSRWWLGVCDRSKSLLLHVMTCLLNRTWRQAAPSLCSWLSLTCLAGDQRQHGGLRRHWRTWPEGEICLIISGFTRRQSALTESHTRPTSGRARNQRRERNERTPRPSGNLSHSDLSPCCLEVLLIPINELICWQGDRSPKGLKGLKGAAGYKVSTPWDKTFNSICLIRK